jgi:hypothetical protein
MKKVCGSDSIYAAKFSASSGEKSYNDKLYFYAR